MTLYDLLCRCYEVSKYTIHLARVIKLEGLSYQRQDTITDPDTIGYSDKKNATVQMFSCKSKGHIEIWACLDKGTL